MDIDRSKYKLIDSETYSSLWQRKSGRLTHMFREQSFSEKAIQTDVFSGSWMLIIADEMAISSVSMGRLGGRIHLTKGFNAIYIPPFELVEWHIDPCTINWQLYSAPGNLSVNFPQGPFAFSWKENSCLQNITQVRDMVDSADAYMLVGKEEHCSDTYCQVASKVKRHIDRNFLKEETFNQIASVLKTSRHTVQRSFKQRFGISPAQYRRKLRVFRSMSQMLDGMSATEACFESGFSDFSQFYRNFKRQTELPPSSYMDSGC